jgi:hypothetical protein
MNGKTKAFTVIAAAVIVCMLVYSPLTQATQNEVSLGDELAIAEIGKCKPEGFRVRPRVKFALWFLKNAEPTQVEGTVVALAQKKLVLNIDEEQIRVNMPIQWTMENEVLTIRELYESHLEGNDITIDALEASIVDKDGLSIKILVSYELSTSEIEASACLKINIAD